MKAHELAKKLQEGPDLEVVFVEQDLEYGYLFYTVIDDVKVVEEQPKQDQGSTVEAPFVELL